MDPVFVSAGKIIEVEGIVYPPCECGEPWSKHGVCGGYKPASPIINHGTVYFHSTDRIANLLFKCERFFVELRKARLRSL